MSESEQARAALVDHLVEYINQEWDRQLTEVASFYAGEFGDEQAARDLIKTFIEYCDDVKINPDGSQEALACWHAMRRMLQRVLDVDMAKPANRKGDLPKAMGLVSRRGAVNLIRDHVIYYACDHAKYNTGVPGRPDEECFDLVAAAIEKTKKFGDIEDGGLTPEQIKKIYQRGRSELLG